MTLTPGKFWGLRRMADASDRFSMLAVDQRPPIKTLAQQKRGEDAPRAADVRAVKRALMETLAPQASAVLADPTYALADALTVLSPEHGLIVTLEDSLFAETEGGRWSKEIDDWSVSKIKRVGADAVKVLAWYRPDQDATSRANQEAFVKRTGEACAKYDIPFLFELLVYPLKGDAHQTKDYIENQSKRAEHVLESVEKFAAPDYGVDVFKLESPIPAREVPAPGTEGAEDCAKLFAELGRLSARPWVMLSAGADKASFRRVLQHAYAAGASGYLAGRAIWWDAFQHFPDDEAMRAGLSGGGAEYMRDLNALTAAEARPWTAWYDSPLPEGFDSEWLQGSYIDLEGEV